MSRFRQLVEDIVKPQQSTTVYQYLTPEHQVALDKEVENAEKWIDISELPTAYYDRNPFDVEPQLVGNSGGWFLEDESYLRDAAIDKVIEYIEADGASQYLWDNLTPKQQGNEEFDAILTKEAIEYLKSEKQHE